ncbi:MAG: class IV adenylate cyclase [Lachnospiraceae bacterium]|nr:class IV adenylate cyclase [Lachnospiraceae bacterium]
MIEVEIKLKVSSPEVVEQQLRQLGFAYHAAYLQEDSYYDNRDGLIRSDGQALRLRTITACGDGKPSSHTCITFKGKKLDTVSMTRQELETEVGDRFVLDRILQALGYQVIPPSVVKHRKEYVRSGFHLPDDNRTQITMNACLDQVDGLGDFLELEMMTDEDERGMALDCIEEMLHKLGYSICDTTTSSYLSMLQGVED